jgi:HTH-type transcriptional regulator/antitoxin MqsA
MLSPETGQILTRGVRPFIVSYKGQSITVGLPGYYPKGDGDGVHVGNDINVVDRALRTLKEKSGWHPDNLRPARRPKLRLSQRRACAVLPVEPNAF